MNLGGFGLALEHEWVGNPWECLNTNCILQLHMDGLASLFLLSLTICKVKICFPARSNTPEIPKAEAGGSQVRGRTGLHSETQSANLCSDFAAKYGPPDYSRSTDFVGGMGVEPRASCMLCKCCAPELHLQWRHRYF